MSKILFNVLLLNFPGRFFLLALKETSNRKNWFMFFHTTIKTVLSKNLEMNFSDLSQWLKKQPSTHKLSHPVEKILSLEKS